MDSYIYEYDRGRKTWWELRFGQYLRTVMYRGWTIKVMDMPDTRT